MLIFEEDIPASWCAKRFNFLLINFYFFRYIGVSVILVGVICIAYSQVEVKRHE